MIMNINKTNTLSVVMRGVGWTGTICAGLLAAKGLGEFLPASKVIVYGLGLGLETMNIVTLAWIASGAPGQRVLKVAMGCLCGIVLMLDVAGVAGQLSNGYQGAVNEQTAVVEVANAKLNAQIAAARAAVESIDHQLDGLTQREQTTALGLAKARGDRDQIRGVAKAQEAIKVERAGLNTKRDGAVAQVAELEAQKGEVAGKALNASSEFAAAQFVARLFKTDADTVAYWFIAVLAGLLPLFSFGMMLAGSHKKPVAGTDPDAFVIPDDFPAVQTGEPVEPVELVRKKGSVAARKVRKNRKRVAGGKKGWKTRAANKAKALKDEGIKAGKVVALTV
jgi:hypothetical protein